MDQIQIDYPNLKRYAQAILSRNKISASADDLINNIIIKLHDKKIDYSFDSFKKEATSVAWKIKNDTPIILPTSDFIVKTFNYVMSESVCLKCKKLLPTTLFFWQKAKNGQPMMLNTCRACINENRKVYKKKNELKIKAYDRRHYQKYKKSRAILDARRKKNRLKHERINGTIYYVYFLINEANGTPFYVGITNDYRARIGEHRHRYKDIGFEFKLEVIESTLMKLEAKELEVFYIHLMRFYGFKLINTYTGYKEKQIKYKTNSHGEHYAVSVNNEVVI